MDTSSTKEENNNALYSTERRKTRWFCNMPLSPVEQKCPPDSSHERTEEKISECNKSNVFEEIQYTDDENISSSSDIDYFPPRSNSSSGPSIISATDEDSDASGFKIPISLSKKKDFPLVQSDSVNNEGASTSTSLDENRAEGTLYYGKRRRQKDFCFFCECLVQCFARHIIRNHTTEPEVQRIISYRPKNPERMKLIADLRKKGNFVNSGTVQKAVKKGVIQKGLLPCSDCLGFYNKAQLWRHRKYYCKRVTSTTTQADAQNFMIRNLKIDDELKQRVFPRMRADTISMTAKSDPLVCAFGARYLKIHRELHFVNVVSRKMREIAKLILEIKKLDPMLNTLLKILKPENFDLIVEATKTIAQYDTNTEIFKSPSYAMNIGTSLKQCCDIAIMHSLKRKSVHANVSTAESEADFKTLIHLINENWKFEISAKAGADLNMKKWNKISIIPLATDLQLLKKYLIEKGNKAASNLSCSFRNMRDYQTLIETVFCRIILLNRRRPGELQRITCTAYNYYSDNSSQNYEEFEDAISPTEKILMKRFKRIVIRGKRGRGVPILFSGDVQQHIDVILKFRSSFAKEKNLYLFPNLNSLEPICGYKILKKYASSCGAKNPDGITCTRLRKHLATLSQVFNMCESDLEQLATFMGHTLGIHRQAYRLPDDVYQTSKIAKILLLMEKGNVGDFQGKTLEEINIDMDEDLLNDTNEVDECLKNDEVPEVNEERSSEIEVSTTGKQPNKKYCSDKIMMKKKTRALTKWTPEQKEVASGFFGDHITQKRAPKKAECEILKKKYPKLFERKDWLKIKVFIQNIYSGKCKI